jgi:transcriptional regulator with XRE-family HTH domain
MNQTTTFGERLTMVMRHKGLNKNSLSVQLGLTANSVIGRIVNDQSRPSYDILKDIVTHFTDINARWLVTAEGSMLGKESASKIDKGEIRYFKSGSGEPFPTNTDDLKATAIMTLYGFTDCQYAFDVFGDSMAPRFRSGDLVLCSDHLHKNILPGEAYWIVSEGVPSIRTVKNETNGSYLLGAENPRYSDYEIKKDEVTHLYLIKGTIRREVF